MVAKLAVCVTCRGGAALAEALAVDGAVERVDCMNVCDSPACLSVRASGKAAYLFRDVDASMAGDVRAFLALYDASPDGMITDARPAGDLRFRLHGRIPA